MRALPYALLMEIVMTKVTIELPATLTVKRFDDGADCKVEWAKIPATLLPDILKAGALVMLTNTYNTGGKAATAAEKRASLEKKLEAWYRGELHVSTRGNSQLTLMREQYVDERKAATGASTAAIERLMSDLCQKVFGKASASFDVFLNAVATTKAKAAGLPVHEIRESIEAPLWERTQEAIAERAKNAAALEVDVADLGL